MSPAMAAEPRLVRLNEQHIPALCTLFEQSVRRIGPQHYSPEQVEQWALGARHPGFVGQLRPNGSNTTPAGRVFFPRVPFPGSGGAPVELTFDPDGSPRIFNLDNDQYNFQPINYLQTPLERQSAALFGRYSVTDSLDVFGELLYSQTQATSQLAPPPAFVPAVVNLDNPLLTTAQRTVFADSFDPDGDGFASFGFARRLEETGPRRLTRDADSLRAVLGIEGELGGGWEWTATVSSSQVRGDTITDNAVFVDRFTQGLVVDPATGACADPGDGCVPFNPFGLEIPGAAVDFLLTGPIREAYSLDEDIVTLAFTGDALSLPAGPVGVAIGAEWRELSSEARPDPRFLGGGVLGYLAGSPVGGTTNVAEAFVEVLVPLLSGKPLADYLGLEAGYRYSDYRFSGVADNWKIGVDWSLLPALRVRAMAQRAIRAPNIDELFRQPREQPSTLFSPDIDRCTASQDPVGNGLADLCIAQGIAADQLGVYEAQRGFPITAFEDGGNTTLEPEEADTLTAGIVIRPPGIDSLSLSVDYYRIEIDNAIGSTSLEEAIALCFDSNDPGGQFCRSLRRAPSGDIAEYTNPQFNLANLRVEGVDVALNYSHDLPAALGLFDGGATVTLTVLGSHALENSTQQTPTTPSLDCAGFYAGACAFTTQQVIPEYRSSTRLTYASGPLTLGLNWQWVGGLDNHLDITCRDYAQFCYPSELGDVASRNYFEVSGRFAFGDHGEVYGGVSNLFEEDPPLMGLGAQQSNTAPSLYDVFGRRFFLGLRYRL